MVRTFCFFCFLLTLALGLAVVPADAQTVTTLHSFGDGNVPNDGNGPSGALVQGRDGNFYGTTGFGGSATEGTVFKMTPSGAVTILHSFDDGSVPNDGARPPAGLIQGADGNFYGTTTNGGSTGTHGAPGSGHGTVFKITPSGVVAILHSFGDGSVAHDGIEPGGLALGTDGNFYGTTYTGGSTGSGSYDGNGTVFKMTPSGAVTILHNFGDGSVTNDGISPDASLVQGRDGNFYGTTTEGGGPGGPSGGGTVFKMTPSGTVTILHDFDEGSVQNDGAYPNGSVVQGTDGNFYGTTLLGGSTVATDPSRTGYGTVYKMTPLGTVTILHSFNDGSVPNDGIRPYAALVQGTDGDFYGATDGGGASVSGSNAYGDGTVFKITSSGSETILHSFGDGSVPNDGSEPGCMTLGTDGNFYGTTGDDGSAGQGTVFRFNPSSVQLLTITSLSPASTIVGGPAFTLTITGTGFTSTTTVTFGGTPVTVTAQTATQLKVTVPASSIVTTGAETVAVSKPNTSTVTAIFTVTPPWNVQDVAAVSDGTARLLWDRSDGAAGIWIMSSSNTETAVGPTYGPYQGWTAQDITAAGDGTSRILWNRYDGATGVWAMDAHGNETTIGPTYGPFSGWKAIDLATAPNGTSRLMWRYTNGQAGILTLNAQGGEIIVGRNYGPYTGWTATAVGAAGDDTARMLWTRSDGAMGLWTMDANDLQKAVGPTYGPYSDSHGHWTATDLSTSADGTSEVLWKRSDGAIGVWTFSANNTMTTVGAVYGPYAGWTVAALDAASDKARVLWVRSDRAAGLWSFGTNDIESLIGPVYGPY